MSNLEVRVVRLDPMTVICTSGFGTSPEHMATEKMLAFMKAQNIDPGSIRWFGFNNPSPSPGSPNYGYDVWITTGREGISQEENISTIASVLKFGGGLYAVTHCVGANNLFETWQQLAHWREDSPYKQAHHQWLEELFNPTETDETKLRFDIYLPIAE